MNKIKIINDNNINSEINEIKGINNLIENNNHKENLNKNFEKNNKESEKIEEDIYYNCNFWNIKNSLNENEMKIINRINYNLILSLHIFLIHHFFPFSL